MSIIMMINLKGGVAKTTSAVAIAECLASQGHRTLLIDADHQCSSGEMLLGEDRQEKSEIKNRTLYDLLVAMLEDDFEVGQIPPHVARKASNIDGGLDKLSVLPCCLRIENFSTNRAKAKRGYNSDEDFQRVLAKRKKQFRRWLELNYDFTIIDCPPSLALQVKFLMSVAQYYIIPCIPDRLSVRGAMFLLENIHRNNFRSIKSIGTLWSMYRSITSMHKEIVTKSAPHKDVDRMPKPFKVVIPVASKITEPNDNPRTFRQKYTLEFAKLFEELCQEIIKRTEWAKEADEEERFDESTEQATSAS